MQQWGKDTGEVPYVVSAAVSYQSHMNTCKPLQWPGVG